MKKLEITKKIPSPREYLRKEMNMLPEDMNLRNRKKLGKISYVLSFFLFAAFILGYNFWVDNIISNRLDEKVSIESKIAKFADSENQKEIIYSIESRIEAKSKAIMDFELISPKVIPVLNSLEKNMPSGISLSGVSKFGSELSLSGVADSQKSVAEYLHNLKEEEIFSYVAVESVSEETDTETDSSKIGFSMSCKFNTDGGVEDGSI